MQVYEHIISSKIKNILLPAPFEWCIIRSACLRFGLQCWSHIMICNWQCPSFMSPYLFELDSENEELTLHHLTNPCLVPFQWELYVSTNLGQGPSRSGLQSSLAQTGLAGMLKGFCTGKELQRDLKWDSGIFENPLCSLCPYRICCRAD